MEEIISANKDLIDLVVQILLIVLPILITWFIRTYVKGTQAERDVAAVMRLSNTAIDYVENLDKQGTFDELALSPDFSKSLHKLGVATDWMDTELQRNGINMSSDDASKWIQAEFQKRVGGVQMGSALAELAETAVQTIRSLEKNGIIVIPEGTDRIAFLAQLAADWVVTQLAKVKGGKITREQAMVWVSAALIENLQTELIANGSPTSPTPQPSLQTTLESLAQQAIAFTKQAKDTGHLNVQAGSSGGDVDLNVATAWLLTEVARQGLMVSTDEIAQAVRNAYS